MMTKRPLEMGRFGSDTYIHPDEYPSPYVCVLESSRLVDADQ